MNIFSNINQSKTHMEVTHQIEALILEGILNVGDRLPGERDLAEKMGVSRPIIREAIKDLEDRKILISKHGGGTFVGDVIGTLFSPQISEILPTHEKATLDYLEYRRELEATAAGFAAARATQDDKTQLKAVMQLMDSAHDAEDFDLEAEVDLEFHQLIGALAHNLVLLHTLRSCYRLASYGIFENRRRIYDAPDGRDRILEQHRDIYKAIINGNAGEARAAARRHLDYVIEQTITMKQQDERQRISRLRAQNNPATPTDNQEG